MASEVDYPVVFERDTESASSICTVGSPMALLAKRVGRASDYKAADVRSNREDIARARRKRGLVNNGTNPGA